MAGRQVIDALDEKFSFYVVIRQICERIANGIKLCLTSCVYSFVRISFKREKEENRSEFYFESASELQRRAAYILSHSKEDRKYTSCPGWPHVFHLQFTSSPKMPSEKRVKNVWQHPVRARVPSRGWRRNGAKGEAEWRDNAKAYIR